MSIRQEYVKLLEQFSVKGEGLSTSLELAIPARDPSLVAPFVPYLSAGQIEEAMQKSEAVFTVPPVRYLADDAVIMVSKDKMLLFSGGLDGGNIGRLRQNAPFQEEAAQYALAHWPEDLIRENPVDACHLYLLDPDQHDPEGNPRRVHKIYLILGRPFADTLSDKAMPLLDALDEAIIQVVIGSQRGELVGVTSLYDLGRPYDYAKPGYKSVQRIFQGEKAIFCCAHDGHGLAYAHCPGCGRLFYQSTWRTAPYPSLPLKVVAALLTQDHVFDVDPAHAQEIDRKVWHEQTEYPGQLRLKLG